MGNGQFDAEMALDCVLAGGDDYELVFTAPPSARSRVKAAALQSETSVTRIGLIEASPAACGLWTPQGSRSTGALLHSITSPAESFTPL
jgi:thiamine monophosphate kinase